MILPGFCFFLAFLNVGVDELTASTTAVFCQVTATNPKIKKKSEAFQAVQVRNIAPIFYRSLLTATNVVRGSVGGAIFGLSTNCR